MSDPDRKIWSGMLAHLRNQHPSLCRQWFEELEPLGMNSGVLHLRALSDVHRDYLRRQCLDPFNDAARTVSGRLLSIRFLGPDEDMAPDVASVAVDTTRSEHSGRDNGSYDDTLVINPDYGFDNFVVGPGNRLAHAAALAVSANPGLSYNPFFVHGDVGLGKTHLLQAICLRISESEPDARIHYTSCEAFMTRFMDAVQAGKMSSFRHRFRNVDVLVIDDIHFLAKRDRTQEEFFHTFNSLYQANKQIVLSSDAPPEEIPDLEERLVSRFKWGLVASIARPCYETRVEIVKSKARLRGIDLPDDVACHVASRIDSNIRELEGAITKLQIESMVEGAPINLELARRSIGDLPDRPSAGVSIPMIVGTVTDFFGVKLTDLQSKRRQRSIALPRQVCMYLARKHTRHSLEEIGGYFGGRDHTTVMHAVRSIEGKCVSDTEFEAMVSSIERELRSDHERMPRTA